MKIGDSIKLKDGRKFKVVSKDNGYFILKDSKGKMAKIRDGKYSEEAELIRKKLEDFAVKARELFDYEYQDYFYDFLNEKYQIFDDEEIKEQFEKIRNYYNLARSCMLSVTDLIVQKINGTSDTNYSPRDMLLYLASASNDFTGTFEEVVENVIKVLKDIDNTQEFLEMYGTNEDMDKAILKFVKENPNFDWESVEL